MIKSNKFNFTVSENESAQRLDKWLCEQVSLKDFIPTRGYAQNMIETGLVTVNLRHSKSSYILKTQDTVHVHIPEPKPTSLVPYPFPLDIIYEDNDVIVINKPSGLVIHPAAGHEQDTLVNALLAHTSELSMKNEQRPGIVHRIDKETSGLLVVAKNDSSHEILSQQFKNKTTHRLYYAIADVNPNKPINPSGTISSYLIRHPSDRKKYTSLKKDGLIINQYKGDLSSGKWAVTHYKVKELTAERVLFELKLETGRTHQIRVHLSQIGYPLVGDTNYNYSVKKAQTLGLERFFLHAAELGFTHPTKNEFMLFKVGWPDQDLQKIKSWGFNRVI